MDLWSKLYTLHWGIRTLAFGVLLYGFYNFVHMMVLRVSTEVAITTRRLVYKRGLIRRAVDEMNIDRIEGVMVRQSILGRILGYGSVVVHGMGVGQVILPTIADPIAFRRAAQHAREYAEADQVQAGRA